MAFKVGDMAVYPGHGVGVVEGVETRDIAGTRQTFYVLKILENGMTVMVPTSNADAIGMRELIDEDETDEQRRRREEVERRKRVEESLAALRRKE